MIEKKITYDINIEKPSKTKPVKQGGVLNFLGKQKTVNAPIKWRSSKDHPVAHLAYITKDEEKILIDLNLYGSLKGKPNRGPFGLPSLQGSGGGAGGDGGGGGGGGGGNSGNDGPGDSGPGGSDDGTGHGGPGPGGPGQGSFGGSEEGFGIGPNDSIGGPGQGQGSFGGSEEGFGIGPDDSIGPSMSQPAESIDVNAPTEETGIMSTVTNAVQNAIQNAINNPVATVIGMVNPVAGMVARAVMSAVDAANRGVTAPNDFSQAQTSVQSNTQSPSNTGGISTIQAYAPLYNPDTGNPTMDAYMRQLRINLGLPV